MSVSAPSPVSTPPPALWFYTDAENQPVGPLPFSDLQRLFEAGVMLPDSFVIEDGGSEWKPLASILPVPVPAATVPATDENQEVIEARGINGTVALLEDHIRITRTGFWAMGGGKTPLLTIPLSGIRSLRWKAPSIFTRGFIRFVLQGAPEPSGNVFAAAQDKHAVLFSKTQWQAFQVFRAEVERRLDLPISDEARAPAAPVSAEVKGRRWPTLLALFLFYPLGVCLLLGSKAFTRRGKLLSGAAFGVWFLLPIIAAITNLTPSSSNSRSTSTAVVSKKEPTLGMSPKQFREAFNEQASRLGLNDRFHLDKITVKEGAVKGAFNLNFTSELSLMGSVSKESGEIDLLTVVASGNTAKAATDLMLLPMLIVATVDPSISVNRRGKVVLDLYRQALEDHESHDTKEGRLKLGAGVFQDQILMFFIQPMD